MRAVVDALAHGARLRRGRSAGPGVRRRGARPPRGAVDAARDGPLAGGGAAGRHRRGLRRRARPPRRRRGRCRRRRGDPLHAPSGQGPRVGRRLPARPGGGHAPDPPVRLRRRRAGRGATPPLRRHHACATPPRPVVGWVPRRREGAGACAAVAVHLRAAAECGRASGAEGPSATFELSAADEPLLERLIEWRRGRARADGVPAYVVADNKTLAAIAVRRPSDAAGLLAVPGIGQRKVAGYGDEILAIVRTSPLYGGGRCDVYGGEYPHQRLTPPRRGARIRTDTDSSARRTSGSAWCSTSPSSAPSSCAVAAMTRSTVESACDRRQVRPSDAGAPRDLLRRSRPSAAFASGPRSRRAPARRRPRSDLDAGELRAGRRLVNGREVSRAPAGWPR